MRRVGGVCAVTAIYSPSHPTQPAEVPMPKKSRPSTRWPLSQIILVAAVATPFALLIYSVISSNQRDHELTAEVNSRYELVDCEVLEVGRRDGSRRERTHPDSERTREVSMGFDPIIEYRYEWRGATYRSRSFSPTLRTYPADQAEAFDQQYAVGTRHRCKIDPDQPARAYIAW
jgi:hypothetical protein